MDYKNQTPVSTVNAVNAIGRKALELTADGEYEMAAVLFYKATIEGELNNINPEHVIVRVHGIGICNLLSFSFSKGVRDFENALILVRRSV